MQYPLLSEYRESIRNAEDNFDKLSHLRPVLDADGEPVMSIGNFAVVFKMTDGKKDYAIKCFTKEQEGRAEAYQQIAEELDSVNSLYITSIKYFEKELFVDCCCEENEFPVLLMDWIDGESMEKFIADNYQDSYTMSMLCYHFCKMATWLHSQPFAHGDLKPDNIIIRPDGNMTLIDYDGMFVPTMNGQKSPTIGTKNFSHPLRTVDDFDETIDDLALTSIALSLKTISLNPSLYSEYCVADRLLFSSDDYLDLSKSKVLTEVQSLLSDKEVAKLLSLFLLALSTKDLSLCSFRPFDVDKPKKILIISSEVTREDLDNAILKEATDIRNGGELSGVSSFNSKGEGVAYIAPEHQEAIDEVLKEYSKLLKDDPEAFRVLAYHNDVVAAYNDRIRYLLGYTKTPVEGEPMVGYANWGYEWQTKSYQLVNSESYKIKRVQQPRPVFFQDLEMTSIPMTLVDPMGNETTIDYIDIKNNAKNKQVATILAKKKQELWAKTKWASKREAIECYKEINAIEKFLCVNEDITETYIKNGKEVTVTLQDKVLDFGYAMTVHKSQGSTFTHVLMDDIDIQKGARENASANKDPFANAVPVNLEEAEVDAKPLAYSNPEGEMQKVDFSALSDEAEVPTSTPSQPSTSEATNETRTYRQQLEYVGVTRATDTVTVISDAIKKEGSPLHPEKSMKEEAINNDNQRSESKKQNGTEEYKTTDEFRRVQEGSRKFSEKGLSSFQRGERQLDDKDKERIGRVLGGLLGANSNGSWHGVQSNLSHVNKDGSTGTFNVGNVDGKLFHDIFETVRTYLPNGELVDLHDDYGNAKCFVTEDGLCGFAIEPDGNLVSVFSLSPTTNKGFLYAIKDMVREEGATHLDAYASSHQPLQEIYAKTLGFHVASSMDYNMDFDQNDIAKNHGMPQVVFMVDHEVAEPKHFDKDSYNAAQQYQLDQLQSKTTTDTSSTPQWEPQAVTLPHYESATGAAYHIPVDAEWKVSYLKELDAQINDKNSKEENDTLIDHMNMVLKAESEGDYKQALKEEREDKSRVKLNTYRVFNEQINNLLDGILINTDGSRDEIPITNTEIRHIAEILVNDISDEITRLQTEPGAAAETYPEIKTTLNFQEATRRQIVDAIGISTIAERIRKNFLPINSGYDLFDTIDKAFLITDNWVAMCHMMSDLLALNENFGMKLDEEKGIYITTEKPTLTEEELKGSDAMDYSNDSDLQAEEGRDDPEHYQIDQKTVDVVNTMSGLVKQGIRQLYQIDGEGNRVKNEFNRDERVNVQKTVNQLLQWCQGAQTMNDVITKLTEKQKYNPWVGQLIERLSDTSGSNSDFQSQFFGIFSKAYQKYTIIKAENGKYYSMPLNNNMALSDAMRNISGLYRVKNHPLFTASGRVNKTTLGSEETIGPNNVFNLHKALSRLDTLNQAWRKDYNIRDNEDARLEYVEKHKEEIANIVAQVCHNLGLTVDVNTVKEVVSLDNIQHWWANLMFITRDLDKVSQLMDSGKMQPGTYNPFAYMGKHSIQNAVKKFITPIAEVMEGDVAQCFYNNGKMYQNYTAPSFTTRLMSKFHLKGEAFDNFIREEYASSEWFRTDPNEENLRKGWRNGMLEFLVQKKDSTLYHDMLDHKVNLDFNGKAYMKKMSPSEYIISLISEYVSEDTGMGEFVTPAWYRFPMQSNKPSSDFFRFISYRGMDYKEEITDHLFDIALQEISRIQTVKARNLSKKDAGYIANYDSNGRKFCFLPVLNSYLENDSFSKKNRTVIHEDNGEVSKDNDRFAELLQKKVNGEETLTPEEESTLEKLGKEILMQSTEDKVQSLMDKWEKQGILEAAVSIKNIYRKDFEDPVFSKEEQDRMKMSSVKDMVENYIWNDSLASKWFLQLTVTDIAFYKDADNLQKRLSQLHSSGTKGYKEAIDYKGKRVSDGKYRTIVVKDFDSFMSNVIDNIAEVFDRRIAEAETPDRKKQIQVLKDSLVRKPGTMGDDDAGGAYYQINVADAQGFCAPSSYRKKAFIFGKWSPKAEEIYKGIVGNDPNFKYNWDELKETFQPLKPFVYGKTQKNLGVQEAPIHNIPVPFQAKNSEFLLLMADGLLKSEKGLARPNLLRAIYRVMEDSEKLNPTKGIDTIQFESAIKSGLQGAIDINKFLDDAHGGEEGAYTTMMESIYEDAYDQNGERVYRDYNTNEYVHELSFDDFCIQQELPEHFKDHTQAEGSQIRAITYADLDMYTTDQYGSKTDIDGNPVYNYYEFEEATGKGYKKDRVKKRLKADEFRRELEQTIADNINESLDALAAELHLKFDEKNPERQKRERNLALSHILQKEITSSPRYGVELLQACSIDEKTGEFKIPKGDPIQCKRIEQLVNSIIKNRVNKQPIKGGPLVQVSSYGTSKELNIRFKDKRGNVLPTKEGYDPFLHDNLTYEEYIKKNQAGIAYFECMVPIWSNEIFEKFANPDGTINIEAIERTDPDLLKLISYRIPTEDKYSCTPMKIVGFLPKESGSTIMLPYDLTTIDGSNFDIDKRYIMQKYIEIRTKSRKELSETYYKSLLDSYQKAHPDQTITHSMKQRLQQKIDAFLDNPYQMARTDKFSQQMLSIYQRDAYYTVHPTSGRNFRNNKIVDMTYSVLTNERTADKLLNPGGFDNVKEIAYKVAAYKNLSNDGVKWKDLEGTSINDLKKLSSTDKDLTFLDTQVDFYKQNAAAASLIGIFAVHKTAQALLQNDNISIDVDYLCDHARFSLGGHWEIDPKTGEKTLVGHTPFEGQMRVDGVYNKSGDYIGKILGSLVGASADAVKDPVLNLLNINPTTANIFTTLLRLGTPLDTASLFLSQNIIEKMISQYEKESLSGYSSLSKVIDKWVSDYEKENSITTNATSSEPITEKELIEGLTSKEHDKIDYKVLKAFQNIWKLSEAMRKITFATRFNSISSAVGPLITDNLITRHKIKEFTKTKLEDKTGFVDENNNTIGISYIFYHHPSLRAFASTLEVAESILSDIPAGSPQFTYLVEALPENLQDKMYKDKKLLDKFANFYQSYLLVQSGLIDASKLKERIEDFPKEVIEIKKKEGYKDNALIQAIQVNTPNRSGSAFLTIPLTGMDTQKKEMLSSAWRDLHKKDPKLSQQLFEYCFFRAGVGFSPKTFMSLLPTKVKETLKSADGKASYVDTYRRFPEVDNETVIEQFIRNNWSDNKLVPRKGGEGCHFIINKQKGTLKIYDKQEIKDCKDCTYIKTMYFGKEYLWKKDNFSTDKELHYTRLMPLGNNGEYLEISTIKKMSPMSETNRTSVKKKETSIDDNTPKSSVKTPTPKEPTETDIAKTIDRIMDAMTEINPKLDEDRKRSLLDKGRNAPHQVSAFFQNVFNHIGMNLSQEEAAKEIERIMKEYNKC